MLEKIRKQVDEIERKTGVHPNTIRLGEKAMSELKKELGKSSYIYYGNVYYLRIEELDD